MIGIIGANGKIGNLCYKLLADNGLGDIKTGVRNKNLLNNNSGIDYAYIDLLDKKSCIDFAKGCDCIINCASISEDGIYNLLEAVELTRGKLVDLTYYDYIDLPDIKNSTIYYGVGSSPGFTESLPLLMSQYFDNIKKWDLYYLSSGVFTHSSAREYVKYINSGNLIPMSRYVKGDIEMANIHNLEIEFPWFRNSIMSLPYIDNRLLETCNLIKPDEANFYICMYKGKVYELLSNQHGKSRLNLKEDIGQLIDLSVMDSKITGFQSDFYITVEGKKQSLPLIKSLIIRHHSPDKLTALISTAFALLLIKEKTKHGIYSMNDSDFLSKILIKMKSLDSLFYYHIYDEKLFDIDIAEGEI